MSGSSRLHSVVDSLLQMGARNGQSTVVMLDKFDRLTSDAARTQFADFIKEIGDKHVPIRFIFCGVAESMQKLLGAHGSCYRYLEASSYSASPGKRGSRSLITQPARSCGGVDDPPPPLQASQRDAGMRAILLPVRHVWERPPAALALHVVGIYPARCGRKCPLAGSQG